MFLSFCFHVAFVSFPVPFILLSCCICFLSRSFHVPFMLHLFPFSSFHVAFISFHFAFISFHVPFILHSCPFIFRRYVSNIQVFEKWYAQTGQVGIRPKARFFHMRCISFLLSFVRFGELCRLPSSRSINMYMYKPVIICFLLLSLSGPVMHW